MQSDNILAETFCTEINSILHSKGDNIMEVFIHYKEAGKKVYEILDDTNFWLKWLHPRIFIAEYQLANGSHISVYVSKRNHNIYYKITHKQKDKHA